LIVGHGRPRARELGITLLGNLVAEGRFGAKLNGAAGTRSAARGRRFALSIIVVLLLYRLSPRRWASASTTGLAGANLLTAIPACCDLTASSWIYDRRRRSQA